MKAFIKFNKGMMGMPFSLATLVTSAGNGQRGHPPVFGGPP